LAVNCNALLGRAPGGTLLHVSKTGEKLLESALRLELPERAELAAELLASLDGAPDEDVEAAWAAEVQRRASRARSGEDPGKPWSEVRTQVRDELADS
jgi:putative addiction module component (TIGR02574 family)